MPVRTKMPVPMIAPTPRLDKCIGPSTRRRRCSPRNSSSSTLCGLVMKYWLFFTQRLRSLLPRPEHVHRNAQQNDQQAGPRGLSLIQDQKKKKKDNNNTEINTHQ